jgi:hypothetical protein
MFAGFRKESEVKASNRRTVLAVGLMLILSLAPTGFANSQNPCWDPPPTHVDDFLLTQMVLAVCCCYNNVQDSGSDSEYWATDLEDPCSCPPPIGGTCTWWEKERHLNHHTDARPGECNQWDTRVNGPVKGPDFPHLQRREECRCMQNQLHVGSCAPQEWRTTGWLDTFVCKTCPQPLTLHHECLRGDDD